MQGRGSWVATLTRAVSVLGVVVVAACSPAEENALAGVTLLDEEVALARGERRDTALREFTGNADATYVAFVDENDTDVKVGLVANHGTKASAASVEVESNFLGEGIEVAALDAPRGARVTVRLEGAQGADRPGRVKLRVVRYAASAAAADPRIGARLAALRAWTAATRLGIGGENVRKTGFRDIDIALAHFESRDGDPYLAAWARLMRGNLNYYYLISWQGALADARLAQRAFGAVSNARNVARARDMEAAALIEIATDKNARNPTAAEASREATRIFTELTTEPTYSALQRARAINNLGYHAYNQFKLPEARRHFLAALEVYRSFGHRDGTLVELSNLAALANEEGDFIGATRFYDIVIPQLDAITIPERRTSWLFNAAGVDLNAGFIDRSIERYLLALQWSREFEMRQHEGRVLYGLGRAYWARGDLTQADTFLRAGLKMRRGVPDPVGLMISLNATGAIARELGDIPRALSLHREAEALSITADLRIRALQEIALDHVAESDFERAAARCREALAIPMDNPNFYRRFEVELALARVLLEQQRRTPGMVTEAAALIDHALRAAIRSADTGMELAARRLLAQTHVARGELAAARREYRHAITLIFKYRSTSTNPELQSATLAHEQATFRGYVDLLMRDVVRRGPATMAPVTPAEEEALRVLEWARAVNFDAVRVSQVDPASQLRIDALLAQMAGKRVRIASLLDRATAPNAEIETLQLDMAKLRAQVDQVRAAGARGAQPMAASPVGGESWRALPPGVAQLSYAFGNERAYLWVRDTAGIRATVLAESPVRIDRQLRTLATLDRMQAPQLVEQSFAQLSATLLPPAALPGGVTTLEIVAEGQIASLPFAALRAFPDRTHRLAETHAITMITSLFETRPLPQRGLPHALRFAALASDPRPMRAASDARVFPALPAATSEVRSITTMFQSADAGHGTKLLLGAGGNAHALSAIWTQGVDVVHFATHGLADLRHPLASMLMLAATGPDGEPTYLTAGEVQGWRGDANLVFLSACETALGPARFADGMPGLQRAFLRAGARGVVATLWPVEDVYAGEFALDFYRRFTTGKTAGEALSETQRAWLAVAPGMREQDQIHRRMTAWAHAFYAE